jgi:hypothetical protein
MASPAESRVFLVAENHRYYAKKAVEEMMKAKIYVADLHRPDGEGNRLTIPLEGKPVRVVKNVYEIFHELRAGDRLRMLVRGGKRRRWQDATIYEAVVEEKATFSFVNIYNRRSDSEFYSRPDIMAARQILELESNAGPQAGVKVEAKVRVSEWKAVELEPYYPPYATIVRSC